MGYGYRNAGNGQDTSTTPPATAGPSIGQLVGLAFVGAFAWFAYSSSKEAQRESSARLSASRAQYGAR